MDFDVTIAAVASAPGHSERSIIRVSGVGMAAVLRDVFSPLPEAGTKPARIAGCVRTGMSVDCPARLMHWPGSKSYTGQPMAELHIPGSPPVVEQVLERIFEAGARPARPGEFTLRAFLAGKVDLAQAEAVLGVIDAIDHEELDIALRQLAGGLSGTVLQLRNDLADLLADLEAGLDFIEEDIEFISSDEIVRRLATTIAEVDRLLSQVRERFQSTATLRVALCGLPNAGKSTLFNALTSDGAAIVSEIEGTTRDYLSRQIDCDGVAVELIDTAGWEFDQSGISDLAQQFRSEQVSQADLLIWCTASDMDSRHRDDCKRLVSDVAQQRPVLSIQTKVDRAGTINSESFDSKTSPCVSAVTGEGLEELCLSIAERLGKQRRGARYFVGSTAARSRDSLHRGRAALKRAVQSVNERLGDELTSLEIRDALDALGTIVGAIYTEDLLDRVFSRFCIGK